MGARSSRPIYIFPADVANATFSRFDTSPGELAVDVAQKYSRGFGWRPDVKFFRVDAKDSDRIVRARDLKDFVADDKLMSPSLPIPRGTWLIAIGKPLGEFRGPRISTSMLLLALDGSLLLSSFVCSSLFPFLQP